MSMPVVTLIYAGVLALLGLAPYAYTGQKTALIPVAFGLLAAIAGGVSFKDSLRKHGMHAAAMVGLLGTLLPLGRLIPTIAQGKVPSPLALFSLSSMAVVSAVFLALCVRSFIGARRARRAAEASDEAASPGAPDAPR
jgi:hypothetical protein